MVFLVANPTQGSTQNECFYPLGIYNGFRSSVPGTRGRDHHLLPITSYLLQKVGARSTLGAEGGWLVCGLKQPGRLAAGRRWGAFVCMYLHPCRGDVKYPGGSGLISPLGSVSVFSPPLRVIVCPWLSREGGPRPSPGQPLGTTCLRAGLACLL